MNRSLAIATVTALSLVAFGCSKTEPKTEPAPATSAPAASSAPVASAAPSTPPPEPVAEEPLPSHAEEDQEAVHDIQKANYKQELDKLEKEVDSL